MTYTDFSDLSSLRLQATTGKDRSQALEQAAKQFEALFLQMMLKSMRDAGGDGDGGLFDNEHTRLYQDMFDKQMSLNLSQTDNGIGLAKVLVQQLKASVPGLQESQENAGLEPPTAGYALPQRNSSISQKISPVLSGDMAGEKLTQSPSQQVFESPEQFVKTMWPHAQRAAEKLGVDARGILAQAALETGWGKAVIRHADGSSSHNLFNIKADQRWGGEKVNKLTVEYRDGVAAKEQAWFRSYDSFADSFDDYVSFLQNNGRYQHALESGPNIALFSERLQQAGYATDPAYASKIQQIVSGEPMNSAMYKLKIADDKTLS